MQPRSAVSSKARLRMRLKLATTMSCTPSIRTCCTNSALFGFAHWMTFNPHARVISGSEAKPDSDYQTMDALRTLLYNPLTQISPTV